MQGRHVCLATGMSLRESRTQSRMSAVVLKFLGVQTLLGTSGSWKREPVGCASLSPGQGGVRLSSE